MTVRRERSYLHLVSTTPIDLNRPDGKGLKAGALGLWGSTVIGLASTAPVYSLVATLGFVVLALLDVVNRKQIRVLEVQALCDAADLDIEVAADELDGHFLACVADGVIHLAKAAMPDAPLDRIALQRARAARIRELQRPGARPLCFFELSRGRIHRRKVLSF